MKKGILLGVIVAAGLLLSCGNNAKAESADNSAPKESVNLSEKAIYKVENGLMKPTNGLPMIVDFSATWCPPCQKLKPIFHDLGEEFKGRINFFTIDVDENPGLAANYEVSSIPALVFINKDGQIQNIVVGFRDKDQLLSDINTYFGF